MKTVAFIQARMSSSRLPGKVLAPLGGMPAIVFMVRRARLAKALDQIVVVTSEHPSDDNLANVLKQSNIACFRGDLDDVLTRFINAAEYYPADRYVRLTGDCPLVDPAIIDAVVGGLDMPGIEYSSNIDPPSYADGLDVEAFTRETLRAAGAAAKPGPEREHVTLWMRGEGSGVLRHNHKALVDGAHLRVTVDYPDDLELVGSIVDALGRDCAFDHYDILRYLDNNRSTLINHVHVRNEAL